MDHWPTLTDIGALDLLLSDDSLDLHKDARLMGLLVRFKTSTAQLNEQCRIIDEYAHDAHGDDKRRAGHQERLMEEYMAWLAWRDAVIHELDDRTYG